MHSIARLDFGNCEVYGKPGWLTVGRVYCSPRASCGSMSRARCGGPATRTRSC